MTGIVLVFSFWEKSNSYLICCWKVLKKQKKAGVGRSTRLDERRRKFIRAALNCFLLAESCRFKRFLLYDSKRLLECRRLSFQTVYLEQKWSAEKMETNM